MPCSDHTLVSGYLQHLSRSQPHSPAPAASSDLPLVSPFLILMLVIRLESLDLEAIFLIFLRVIRENSTDSQEPGLLDKIVFQTRRSPIRHVEPVNALTHFSGGDGVRPQTRGI